MVASRGATAVLRTRVAPGVAHLRVHSSICASRLYAPHRMGAAVAIRGPAMAGVAGIVRRLPATAVRIAHPVTAAVAPHPMAVEVVDITAAEVVVAVTPAEAAVGTPGVAEVVTRVAAVATPAVVIAKKVRDEQLMITTSAAVC